MNMIVVRHAEARHTADPPESLQLRHPALTEKGRKQAEELHRRLPLKSGDLVCISPTVRTLETFHHWNQSEVAEGMVTPWAGPRIFPQRKGCETLPCDEILSMEEVSDSSLQVDERCEAELWEHGINLMPDEVFFDQGRQFLTRCRKWRKGRVFLLSHDGTITSYREILESRSLTRNDFLLDAGWVHVHG
ncbi:histidine phosphatase family protein [Halobacillus litoralis]|uniref:Histidine phosphatase family protein n=2 Tax=Halobacillus litoralis TaxID=45668 RepID=A0A845DWZ1_9BACI|nr:histidine phosphatase family protein [Halobacillus litoralis]